MKKTMRSKAAPWWGVVAALTVVGVWGVSRVASAQPAVGSTAQITVRVGATTVFQLPRQPQFLSSQNPAVAAMVVLPDGRVQVRGVSAGQTQIVGRDFAEMPFVYAVTVTP